MPTGQCGPLRPPASLRATTNLPVCYGMVVTLVCDAGSLSPSLSHARDGGGTGTRRDAHSRVAAFVLLSALPSASSFIRTTSNGIAFCLSLTPLSLYVFGRVT